MTRNNIYGIYKALRHFGVSGAEVANIAKGYKVWLKKPIEQPSDYGFVYYHNGIFYSMPFPVRGLTKELVGIEMFHNFYLAKYVINVRKDCIQLASDGLKKLIFSRFPEEQDLDNIKFELPSDCLIQYLLNKNYENRYLRENMVDFSGKLWVSTCSKNSADGIAVAQDGKIKIECPTDNDIATLVPMVRARDIDFVGRLNFYGVPGKETAEMYRKLLDDVKH